MHPISRRRFLWSSLALSAGGVVLLEACGGDDDGGGGGGPLAVLIASADLSVGTNRLAFGVLDEATGHPYRPKGSMKVGFTAPVGAGNTNVPAPANLVDAPFHGEGLDIDPNDSIADDHGVYVTTAHFDRPGPDADPWWIWAEADGRRGVAPVAVAQVPRVVAEGEAAPKAASPTLAAPLSVDPICTRSPVCTLHETNLADVIGVRPVVVSFSTPARCTSRLCGPSLDLMLEQVPSYQDRVAFVHVEIYLNNQTTDVIPTLADWRLQTEPWMFGVAADGTVVARLDGAFDRPEVKALIDRAAATAT